MKKTYTIMSSCNLGNGKQFVKPLEETDDPKKADIIKREYQAELGVMYRIWVEIADEEEAEPFLLVKKNV